MEVVLLIFFLHERTVGSAMMAITVGIHLSQQDPG